MPALNSNYAGNNGRSNVNYNGSHNGAYGGRNNDHHAGRYNGNSNDGERRGYNGGGQKNYNGNYNGNGYGGGPGNREQRDAFSYEITDSYGALSESSTGWRKELNRVSWNGNAPKFDIREWSPDHGRMRRGVTFTEEEALELRDLLEIAISGLPVSAFDAGPLIDDSADSADADYADDGTDCGAGMNASDVSDEHGTNELSDTGASHDAA